jgi:uncharacterized protein (TIGR02302 family)
MARLVLRVESIWPHLVWLASGLACFTVLVLFDVLPTLPGWLHLAVLAGFLGLVGWGGVRLIRHWPQVGQDQADRRLEQDSGFAHRPLSTLADQPTGAGILERSLWAEHQRRALAGLVRARLDWPRSDMAARDPWGLRAGALLLLVIALAGGSHEIGPRVQRAFSPGVSWPSIGPDSVEVWITPPAYTGIAPVVLRPDHQAVTVPTGSTVLAVASGGWGGETLAGPDGSAAFEGPAGGDRRAETALGTSGRLAVTQWGLGVAEWRVAVVADAVPSIEFTEPPQGGERGGLRLSVTASDDYGLDRLWVEIRRAGLDGKGQPLVLDLPLGSAQPKTASITSWQDLTAHPWAGLPVTMRAMARDAHGQESGGEWVAATLPQRNFVHPGAKLVEQQRRRLMQPSVSVLSVIRALDAISNDRMLFGDDLLAFLALRVARHALVDEAYDQDDVLDVLWNAALRIEDGDLPGAERGLEQARQSLEQAVREGQPAEKIARLVDALEAALQRWMQAMRAGGPENQDRVFPSDQMLDADDLGEMMDRMRDMARSGSRGALQSMLDDLAGLLRNVQRGGPGADDPAALEALRKLRGILKEQSRLLEDSHGKAGIDPPPSGQEAAKAQESLTDGLDDLVQRSGGSEGLEQALGPMREAAGALRRNGWAEAVEGQTQAVDHLREALSGMARQLSAGGAGSPRRDALGRPLPGRGDDGSTRVPTSAETQKSQIILQELRRRAGEAGRSQSERDYIRRLLRQF